MSCLFVCTSHSIDGRSPPRCCHHNLCRRCCVHGTRAGVVMCESDWVRGACSGVEVVSWHQLRAAAAKAGRLCFAMAHPRRAKRRSSQPILPLSCARSGFGITHYNKRRLHGSWPAHSDSTAAAANFLLGAVPACHFPYQALCPPLLPRSVSPTSHCCLSAQRSRTVSASCLVFATAAQDRK
ncbi:hypothetical protein EJ03DRAFT_330967 [Teratosphaeria nubilosa]|uniref:Uncharacterized protein n=1 Tax=Teratosphaeria nubilosa TaxID=161662 RepID=A0A6G1KYR3_9PEZI|nr:hypothetical protein EJ03DRAFT_330967 [Teratosphaeria nubilosa]